MPKTRWNTAALLAKYKIKHGKALSYRDIEEESGIDKNIISKMCLNRPFKFTTETIDALRSYFSKKLGEPILLSDLLVDEDDEGADGTGAIAAPTIEPTQLRSGKASSALRIRLREELTEGVSASPASDSRFLAREGDRRAMLIAQASQRIR